MNTFIKKLRNLSKLYILLCDGKNLLNQFYVITILFDVLISIAFPLMYVIMIIFVSLTIQSDEFQSVRLHLVFGIWIVEFLVGITYLDR